MYKPVSHMILIDELLIIWYKLFTDILIKKPSLKHFCWEFSGDLSRANKHAF